MIAAIAGLVAIRYGKRLDRLDRRASRVVEAYADWAKALEETLSHHDNWYKLAAQRDQAVAAVDVKARWEDELIRVSRLAGDAGRRLDGAHYRILLLDTRKTLRDAVSRITADTMMIELRGLDARTTASAYSAKADQIRHALKKLLAEHARSGDLA